MTSFCTEVERKYYDYGHKCYTDILKFVVDHPVYADNLKIVICIKISIAIIEKMDIFPIYQCIFCR